MTEHEILYTPEQLEGIEYTGSNILLAAAAGSGKTAVLTERVIRKILNEDDETNIDDLLILTFTEAVAGEMKQKINKRITEQMLKTPENKHISKQSIRINRANISTIHSFCLDVIKNNIHLTNIPAEFSIGSENECDLLKNLALNEVLSSYYNVLDKKIHAQQLFDGYGNSKSDAEIRELVLSLHKFSKSMPYPEKWLYGCIRRYREIIKSSTLSGTFFEMDTKEYIKSFLQGALELYPDLLRLAGKLPSGHPYFSFLADEQNSIKSINNLIDPSDWDNMYALVGDFKFETIKTPRNQEEWVVEIQDEIKRIRNIAKARFGQCRELVFADEKKIVSRIAKTLPALRALVNIVVLFDKRYKQLKIQRNMLDFNDLEHEMIGLISDRYGKPTALARQLAQRYKEILIDEYQDINELQDAIFRLISRNGENIFMVGDIKQSIYKFRAAAPTLFLEKYYAYGTGAAGVSESGHLIKLYKNFRSCENVINTVNFIFRSCMSSYVGDVEYTDDEKLIFGKKTPVSLPDDKGIEDVKLLKNSLPTEFYLIDPSRGDNEDENAQNTTDGQSDENDDEQFSEELNKYDVEAILVARRIREIVDSKEKIIYDDVKKSMRSASYKDFVILSRTVNGGVAEAFEKRLFDASIPVYSDVGSSYLNSAEVLTVLSFLQIIDNPLQDIPLIAVMRSPMFKFDADRLAKIRMYNAHKNIPFYIALSLAAKDNDEKARKFISDLDELRQYARETGIDRLIWHIYTKFGYLDYVGRMKGGGFKQANLRLLFERAAEFEKTRFHGLFNFNNYINTMIQEGRDLSPAKTVGENDDVVRVMSIHTSKGLEFPIVILAGTGKNFNTKDITHPKIIWHERFGLGAYCIDSQKRVQYPSLTRTLVAKKKYSDMISEEMRLLYVALTRAKEKLIIVGTIGHGAVKRWEKVNFLFDERVSPHYAQSAKSHLDWIVPALCTHENGQVLRELLNLGDEVITASDFKLQAFVSFVEAEANKDYNDESKEDTDAVSAPVIQMNRADIEPDVTDGQDADVSGRELSECYDETYEILGDIPVKLSVSEIKRQQMAEDDLPVPYFKYSPPGLSYNKDSVSGVLRGVITHFVLQHIDEHKTDDLEGIQSQVEKMVESGMITDEQSKAVNVREIYSFFKTPVGIRLKNAVRVEKEVKFYMQVPACELYPQMNTERHKDRKILIQGVVDCFFVEENEGVHNITIVDYKTDSVTKDSAHMRAKEYKTQLDYYARGLKDIYGLDVKEKYLYFLACDEIIKFT